MIVNSGGIAAVVDYVTESTGNARLPGIMTLGYIAAFSETLAYAVIVAKGVQPLSRALEVESEQNIKAACSWALGQIGHHSPDHAKCLAENAVLPKLLNILSSNTKQEYEEDLRAKTERALKSVLEKTLQIEALEPLLELTTPESILKHVVLQFSKILPNDIAARRAFVTRGGLQRIQEISAYYKEKGALVGSKLGEAIIGINECYPEEIIRYFSPGYSATLLEKIEDYPLPSKLPYTSNQSIVTSELRLSQTIPA